MERLGEAAFALHIQVSEQEDTFAADYRLWMGVLFGPPTSQLLEMEATPLNPELARKLMHTLKSAHVSAFPKHEVWLHPIKHRLQIDSIFNSSTFSWQDELPEGWRELQPAVDLLKRVACADKAR